MGLFSSRDTTDPPDFTLFHQTGFTQFVAAKDSTGNSIGQVRYEVDATFYMNPSQDTAYMVGEVQDRIIDIPNAEVAEQLKALLDEKDQKRIFAYSITDEGIELLTGNFGLEIIQELEGRLTPQMIKDANIGNVCVRNVKERNVKPVLQSHRNLASGLQLESTPDLVEDFIACYRRIHTFELK